MGVGESSKGSFTVRVRKEFEVQKGNRTCQRLLGGYTNRDVRTKREVQILYTGSLQRQGTDLYRPHGKCIGGGLPWMSSGYHSMLPTQGAQAGSLDRELYRYCMPQLKFSML